jgi:hypothetical protein
LASFTPRKRGRWKENLFSFGVVFVERRGKNEKEEITNVKKVDNIGKTRL